MRVRVGDHIEARRGCREEISAPLWRPRTVVGREVSGIVTHVSDCGIGIRTERGQIWGVLHEDITRIVEKEAS